MTVRNTKRLPMSVLLGLAFATGCTETSNLTLYAVDEAAVEYLNDDIRQIPEHTQPLNGARASLHTDWPNLPGDTYSSGPLTVVDFEDHRDEVRVSLDAAGVQVLLWLDRADLQPKIHTSSWSQQASSSDATGTGVYFPAATPVYPIETDQDQTLVQFESHDFFGEIWLHSALVDEVSNSDQASPNKPEFTEYVVLNPSTQLFTSDAEPLAELKNRLTALVVDAPNSDPDFVEVWVEGHHLTVRGFVDSAQIHRNIGLGGFGSYTSGCGGVRFGNAEIVPRDTPLFDQENGEIVGRTLGDEVFVQSDGWFSFTRQSPLGVITLWAPPRDWYGSMDDYR